MRIEEIAGDLKASAYIPGQATAGSADAWPVFTADRPVTITGVSWVPAAVVTGAATNNFALAAQNRGTAGSSTTAVTATKTYASGTNSVAHDIEALTLSSTDANLNLATGEVLALVRTVNGTGLAQPGGLVVVTYRYRGNG